MNRVENIEQRRVEKLKEKAHTDDDSKWTFPRDGSLLFRDKMKLLYWLISRLMSLPTNRIAHIVSQQYGTSRHVWINNFYFQSF